MDDKLKQFLEGDDDLKHDKDSQPSEDSPIVSDKKSGNKYDAFFEDGEQLVEKASEVLGKAGDVLGEKLSEAKEFLGESLKETGRFFKQGSSELNDIVKDDIIPKAKEVKGKLDTKVEGLTDDLKAYADSPITTTPGAELDESLIDTHSGFFDKMEKFADRLEGKGKVSIEDAVISTKEDNRPTKGFEDLDGDGDDLIDDAIIVG